MSRVKCVRAYTQTAAAKGDQGGDCHDVADNHWIDGGMSPIACPMAVTMASNCLCILLPNVLGHVFSRILSIYIFCCL